MTTETTFWLIGLAGAFLFCVPQVVQTTVTVEGVSVAQLTSTVLFLALQLSIAYDSPAAQRSMTERRIIHVYWAWFLNASILTAAVFWSREWTWTGFDTAVVAIIYIAANVIWHRARRMTLDFADARMKAAGSITCKALPQFLLAGKMWHEGGDGFTTMAMIMGHVVILSRLVQMTLHARTRGWQKNQRCLFASELANEASWMTCTAAWIAA